MKNSTFMEAEKTLPPGPESGFIADAMLGTLAKWLRILGVDVEYEKVIEDQHLIRRARSEKRVVLTRDARLAERRWSGPVRIVWIRRDGLSDQLLQVTSEFSLRVGPGLFSRCIRCNSTLRPYSRNRAFGRVPAYVWRTRTRFRRCPVCGRIYWHGTHQARMISHLHRLLESASPPPLGSNTGGLPGAAPR